MYTFNLDTDLSLSDALHLAVVTHDQNPTGKTCQLQSQGSSIIYYVKYFKVLFISVYRENVGCANSK